jgi:hypothetical protein
MYPDRILRFSFPHPPLPLGLGSTNHTPGFSPSFGGLHPRLLPELPPNPASGRGGVVGLSQRMRVFARIECLRLRVAVLQPREPSVRASRAFVALWAGGIGGGLAASA